MEDGRIEATQNPVHPVHPVKFNVARVPNKFVNSTFPCVVRGLECG